MPEQLPVSQELADTPWARGHCRRFEHTAMATTFEMWVFGRDARDADQAVLAAFDLIDQLEKQLSYFIPSSDVSRINRLHAGESLRIGPAAFDCIELSMRVHGWTDGAFDPTIGAMIAGRRPWDEEHAEHGKYGAPVAIPWRDHEGPVHVGMSLIELNHDLMAVAVLTDHVAIDLGGIGKGYALDAVAGLLRAWGIESAMLSAGRSTMLPIGLPPNADAWRMRVIDPRDERTELAQFEVTDQAVSVSAASAASPHILDPATGEPALGRLGAWALADAAALADALSTAFVVMPQSAMQPAAAHADACAMLLTDTQDEGPMLQAFGPMRRLTCPVHARPASSS